MKTNKIRFIVLALSFSVFINLFYSNNVVMADEVTTEYSGGQAEEQYNKEKNQEKGVKLLSAANDSYLTVDHLGLFDSNDVDDVLTVPNYDNYYHESNNILKTAIVNKFVQNEAPFTNGNLSNSLLADVLDGNTENKFDIYDTYFPVTTNGTNNDKHVMMFNYWNSDREWHVSNVTIPNCPSDMVIVDGVFISRSEFEADSMSFKINNNGYDDYTYEGHYTLNDAIHLDTTDNLYKMDYHNNVMFAYSDIPIYFKYYDIEGTEDDYLSETYHYNNYMDVYNAIGNDDTGFVIDRRLNRCIGAPEIDHNLGFVDGSFYNLFGGASKDNMQMLVLYEMNNYTKSRRNSLKLCQDYTFTVDGTVRGQSLAYSGNYLISRGIMDEYEIGSSNYLQIDLSKTMSGRNIFQYDDTLYQTISNYYASMTGNGFYSIPDSYNLGRGEVSPIMLLSYLIDAGFTGSSQVYDGFYDSNYKGQIEGMLSTGLKKEFGIKWNIDSHNTSHREWYNDELRTCKLTVRQYLEDKISGDTSPVNIWEYNFLTGEVNNNNALVKDNTNENDEVIPWDGSYPYGLQPKPINPYTPIVNPAQTLNPNIYPSSTSQGGSGGSATGGNASVIVNTGNGNYYVVDVPADEILKKTPNLKAIITDFKDMLDETKEESILPLITQTYNFIPAPVWNYILYGVGVMLAIGIWRAITRRN